MQAYLPIIISAIVIFTALMWWLLALGKVQREDQPTEELVKPDPQPTIAPSAPKAVADLAREMPKATTPVPLKAGVPAKPKAKSAAPKAKTATPKVKAVPAPKAKATAPKATAAASKPKAAPKGKVETPKVNVAAPKPKVEAPKAKAVPAPKAKAAPAPKAKAAPAPKPKPTPAPKVAPAAAPKAAVAAKPKTVAAPKPAPKAVIPDNLELLKGVGPKVTAMLKDMGITSFEDVANWTPADVREIDSKLGAFAGRISRDNWVDQAKLLSAGDIAGFEKKYGALGSEVK